MHNRKDAKKTALQENQVNLFPSRRQPRLECRSQ
jgi:hypothetical protein